MSPESDELSVERRLLIGAYFTHEYSIEAAALSNPSIVPAPDQEGLAPGEQRFVLSLRAIGEGHISSIEFRSGVIDAGARSKWKRRVGARAPRATELRSTRSTSSIPNFVSSTYTTRSPPPSSTRFPMRFTLEQLETMIREVDQQHGHRPDAAHVTRTIHWLASSNYESSFAPDSKISERVLFPAGPDRESRDGGCSLRPFHP